MMLAGGTLGNARILSRPSVELMTQDHLAPEQRKAAGGFLGANIGWGFGLSVVTRRDRLGESVGRFGWDGGLGTSWHADPRERLTGVLLTQQAWTSAAPPKVTRDFWTAAYQAIGS
jgi:CubicO group peptidase (beta-lactamase class C family)